MLLAHTPPALWRSPMAAALLGALLVLGFNVFSCIILLKWVPFAQTLFPGVLVATAAAACDCCVTAADMLSSLCILLAEAHGGTALCWVSLSLDVLNCRNANPSLMSKVVICRDGFPPQTQR